jgi:hypothetical protein
MQSVCSFQLVRAVFSIFVAARVSGCTGHFVSSRRGSQFGHTLARLQGAPSYHVYAPDTVAGQLCGLRCAREGVNLF